MLQTVLLTDWTHNWPIGELQWALRKETWVVSSACEGATGLPGWLRQPGLGGNKRRKGGREGRSQKMGGWKVELVSAALLAFRTLSTFPLDPSLWVGALTKIILDPSNSWFPAVQLFFFQPNSIKSLQTSMVSHLMLHFRFCSLRGCYKSCNFLQMFSQQLNML